MWYDCCFRAHVAGLKHEKWNMKSDCDTAKAWATNTPALKQKSSNGAKYYEPVTFNRRAKIEIDWTLMPWHKKRRQRRVSVAVVSPCVKCITGLPPLESVSKNITYIAYRTSAFWSNASLRSHGSVDCAAAYTSASLQDKRRQQLGRMLCRHWQQKHSESMESSWINFPLR